MGVRESVHLIGILRKFILLLTIQIVVFLKNRSMFMLLYLGANHLIFGREPLKNRN